MTEMSKHFAPRVVAAWLDARRERMYSGDSETEKIANTTLEFAAHDLRRTSGLSPVVDPPAPAPVAQGERERIKKLDAVVGAGDTAHVAWMMFEDDGGRAEYDRLVLAMTAFRFALDAARKP